MREPCLCGATDCPRCFPWRVPERDADDFDEPYDWPDDDAADRAAARWEEMRDRQATGTVQ